MAPAEPHRQRQGRDRVRQRPLGCCAGARVQAEDVWVRGKGAERQATFVAVLEGLNARGCACVGVWVTGHLNGRLNGCLCASLRRTGNKDTLDGRRGASMCFALVREYRGVSVPTCLLIWVSECQSTCLAG